jgi:multiple sugar transport system permease protein
MQTALRRTGLLLACALLVLWSLLPVYWALVTSLTPTPDLTASTIRFFPETLTFDHYAKLFGVGLTMANDTLVWQQFRAALINSVITSLAATVVCVGLAAAGAYAFVRLSFPGRSLIFTVVVATFAIPGYTVLIPLYRIMTALHLVDTYTGVTLIYVSAFLPLALWLMRSVYQSLPISIEEAARIDGASRLYTLVWIVLPVAAPGLVAAAIITFLGAWGMYMVPLIFSPTMATKPLTILVPEFATKNFVDFGLINAAGSIAIIVPTLIVIFLNRYLVSGLVAGAVK